MLSDLLNFHRGTKTMSSIAFTTAEVKERENLVKIFQKRGITDYEFTPIGSNKRYDFIFRKDDKTFIGDIKNRNIKSTTYADSLIDKSKIDYLISEATKNNQIPLIIATYTDGEACVWSLFKEIQNMKEEVRECNKTTAIKSKKIAKAVCLLKIENAAKIRYND